MNVISQRLNSMTLDAGLIAGCLALVLGVVWAYWPGLSGPFVLDDFGSIAALGHRGGVVDWETFKAFVFGGNSGPTGRPMSLVTFLIDANNWPAEAWPFKRTNLIIHCLCGGLVAILTNQILSILRYDSRDVRWLVVVAAGIWLLHPFLVSTTLYVVQRMAQLSTLFTLAGLIFYLRGRVLFPINARQSYVMMTLSIVMFTALATLSKENGVLLPLLVAVIEVTVIASQREILGRLNRYWYVIFLAVPTVVVMVYLGSRVMNGDFFDIVPPRDFSIYERVLTQPRILFEYLQHWFIPKLYTTGVFQDHFIKSTGLLSPVTTALSIFAHGLIIAIALHKRRHWPLFALAALFFYASHLIESTVVNLELYFEHRNYLASSFLSLPLLVALHRKVIRSHFILIGLTLFLLLGGFTRYSSSVWASWPSMVEASARKAPSSERAQAQYAVLLFNAGLYEESIRVLDEAIKNISGSNALLKVNRLISLCQLGRLSSDEFDSSASALAALPYDARMIKVYSILADDIVSGKCPSVSKMQLNALFVQMLDVPFNSIQDSMQYSQVQYLVGLSYAHIDRPKDAVKAFTESLAARPGASHAMQMAAVLASKNYGVEALRLSEIALAELNNPKAGVVDVAPVSESDIRIFQETVRADIKALTGKDTSGAD